MFGSELWDLRSAPTQLPVHLVPVVGESISAGWPSPGQDYFSGDIDLNEHLLPNRTSTFVARVSGDSMIGIGIYHGDELIIDRSVDATDGAVVVAIVDGEPTLKTLRLTATGAELHPANPAYPILRPRELLIWGVVISSIRHLT